MQTIQTQMNAIMHAKTPEERHDDGRRHGHARKLNELNRRSSSAPDQGSRRCSLPLRSARCGSYRSSTVERIGSHRR
jgi:hypothetical protein